MRPICRIFAGFGIAPSIAGGFGAVIYLLVKFGVLARRNPFPYALATGPIVFFTAAGTQSPPLVARFRSVVLKSDHLSQPS